MKYETYKKLTEEQKEEYNYTIKEPINKSFKIYFLGWCFLILSITSFNIVKLQDTISLLIMSLIIFMLDFHVTLYYIYKKYQFEKKYNLR